MIHGEKMLRLLAIIVVVLLILTSAVQAAQQQINNSQTKPVPMNNSQPPPVQTKIPVKISFNISPNSSYFWAAALSEDGNFSWAGLPSLITIRVGIGGPVYTIGQGMSMPFLINTGDTKFVAGSDVLVAVQIDSKNGYRVANKLYTFPVSNSTINITLMGPTQPVVYKPVFNP